MASACAPLTLVLPVRPEDRTLVLLIDGAIGLEAIVMEPEPQTQVLHSVELGDELLALGYARSRESLGLAGGNTRSAPSDESGRALDPPDHASVAIAGDELAFVELDATKSPTFRRFRVPMISPNECAQAGGCPTEGPAGSCTTPCPIPSSFEPPSFTEPEAPAAPVLQPCAPGFVEQSSGCAPKIAPRDAPCAVDEGPRLGFEGCVRFGAACPSGRFPEGLPTDRPTFYVDSSAAPGGDGTQAAPFAQLGAAVERSVPGSVVAIAAGRYAEELELVHDLSLIGACARDTVLVPPDSIVFDRAISVVRGVVSVQSLRIEGGLVGALAFGSEAGLDLEGVIISATKPGWGALVAKSGGRVTGRDLLIRDSGEHGLIVEEGSTAELDRATFERTAGRAVGVTRGAGLSLSETSIRGTGLEGLVSEATNVTLSSVLFEGTRTRGLALAAGSTLTASGLFMTGVRPLTRDPGSGVTLEVHGSRGSVDHAVIELASSDGLRATRSEVSLAHVLMLDQPGAAHAQATTALDVGAQSILVGNRLSIQTGGAALAMREEARAELADVEFIGVSSRGDLNGIRVTSGASLELRRARVESSHGDAIEVTGPLSRLVAVDLAVLGARYAEGSIRGTGVMGWVGAELHLERLLVEDNDGWGVNVATGSRFIIDDARISAQGRGGLGLVKGVGQLSRAEVSDNEGVGVLVDEASELTGEATTIRGTQAAGSCTNANCAGSGLLVVAGRATFTRFRIQTNASDGVDLDFGAEVDLEDGEVTGNLVGADISAPGFEPTRLFRRVRYAGNREDFRIDAP